MLSSDRKMEQDILSKSEHLKKYLPFIDYLLSLDKDKYTKFVNIKEWIWTRKRYPIDVLEKIEQSIITQYRNLFISDDIKPPKEIMNIFNTNGEVKCLNLCSDEEEEEESPKVGNDESVDDIKEEGELDTMTDESDDDVKIVSFSVGKQNEQKERAVKVVDCDRGNSGSKSPVARTATDKSLFEDDQETTELLTKIDKMVEITEERLAAEDNSHRSWQDIDNDMFVNMEIDEQLDVKGGIEEKLFKRRKDFDNVYESEQKKHKKKRKKRYNRNHRGAEKENNKHEIKKINAAVISETISIDSSEDECTTRLLAESDPIEATKNITDLPEPAVTPMTQNGNGIKSATPGVVYSVHVSEAISSPVQLLRTTDLENMDLEQLNQMAQNLGKQNSAFIEQYLKMYLTNMNMETPQYQTVVQSLNANQEHVAATSNEVQEMSRSHLLPQVSHKIPTIEQLTTSAAQFVPPPPQFMRPTRHFVPPLPQFLPPPPQFVPPEIQFAPPFPQFVPPASQFTPTSSNSPQMTAVLPPLPPLVTTPPPPSTIYSNIQRINLKDPRIMRQLKTIENSPLCSFAVRTAAANVLAEQTANTEHYAAVSTTLQPPQPSTYGEYKRQKAQKELEVQQRKDEKRLEAERKLNLDLTAESEKRAQLEVESKRKRELEAKRQQQDEGEAKKIEEREQQRQTDDIRKILMNTLQPYENKIQDILRKESEKTSPERSKKFQRKDATNEEALAKAKISDKKVSRALKGLECTVNGYNKMADFLPKTIGGKRRSSVCARSAISEQLNAQHSTDEHIDEREHVEIAVEQTSCNIPKRRKTLDREIQNKGSASSSYTDVIDFAMISQRRRRLAAQVVALDKQPVIKLHRLTKSEIAQYSSKTKTLELETAKDTEPMLNVELVENRKKTANRSSILPEKNCIKSPAAIRRRNVDPYMTERNTRFCLLCKAKPANLTNHYLRSHKMESYVARFSSVELDELQMNIPFAVVSMSPSTSGTAGGSLRNLRYKVKCPFCDAELIDSFINFYAHYSSHTGEYAYQCASCKLQRPYRADIQSHQLHAKTCRNSRIQHLYQYPPNIMVIYLHSCNICNFVQLNEANVYKHLRDHHGNRQDDPSCVKKYILAAIYDGEGDAIASERDDRSVDNTIVSELLLPKEDIDAGVTVGNEPLLEDSFTEEKPQVEDLLSELFQNNHQEFISEPQLLNAVHKTAEIPTANLLPSNIARQINQVMDKVETHPTAASQSFMTVIHCPLQSDAATTPRVVKTSTVSDKGTFQQLHRPIPLPDIKPDIKELEAQLLYSASHRPTAITTVVDTTKQQESLIVSGLCPQSPKPLNDAIETVISTKKMTITLSPTRIPFNLTHRHNTPRRCYKTYASDTSSYGLYKCVVTDCYFCSDVADEMLAHLKEHIESECPPADILGCAYCHLDADLECSSSPQLLVAHITKRHSRSPYQCAMCCYRSCLPGNIVIHRQHLHQDGNYSDNKNVYVCYGNSVSVNERLPQMIKNMLENVHSITCTHCTMGFFAISSMEKHLCSVHNVSTDNIGTTYNQYVCIYCGESLALKKEMQNHLALRHPDDLAYVCERVLKRGIEIDTVHNLQLNNIALTIQPKYIRPVPRISSDTCFTSFDVKMQRYDDSNVTATCSASLPTPNATRHCVTTTVTPKSSADATGNLTACELELEPEEAKPNIDKLCFLSVELVKPLLFKLTIDTGVPPDRLYRCPQPACGGFFSIYKLWRRHMLQRHCCIFVACPHCCSTCDNSQDIPELPLEEFETHFEQHSRHLYICFHCGETYVNEQQLRAHATNTHAALSSEMRLEKIPFNISYSYFVLISLTHCTERLQFLQQLQDVLQTRLIHMENLKASQLLTEWPVLLRSAWVENYPVFTPNTEWKKRCICRGCTFSTCRDVDLYEHLRHSHLMIGKLFRCSKCTITLGKCGWDVIIDHVKMHNNDLYICCVCDYYHYERNHLSQHIRQMHDSRDVPVLSLMRSKSIQHGYQTRVAIDVVFATGMKSFSTLSNCFCCQKTNLSRDSYGLHLKSAHMLKLFYACELCSEQLPQLQQCENHYKCKHPQQAMTVKLRCTLAAIQQMHIEQVVPLNVHVSTRDNKHSFTDMDTDFEQQLSGKKFNPDVGGSVATAVIKQEQPDHVLIDNDDEDEVTVLEEDDVIAAAESNTARRTVEQSATTAPMIKCVNIENLMSQNVFEVPELATPSPPPVAMETQVATINTPSPRSAGNASIVKLIVSSEQAAKLGCSVIGANITDGRPREITLKLIPKPMNIIAPELSMDQQVKKVQQQQPAQKLQQTCAQQQMQPKSMHLQQAKTHWQEPVPPHHQPDQTKSPTPQKLACFIPVLENGKVTTTLPKVIPTYTQPPSVTSAATIPPINISTIYTSDSATLTNITSPRSQRQIIDSLIPPGNTNSIFPQSPLQANALLQQHTGQRPITPRFTTPISISIRPVNQRPPNGQQS